MKNLELANLIDELAALDQDVQVNFLSSLANSNSKAIDEMENFQRLTFYDNCEKCKSIFNIHGFPGISEVGKKSSYNFWLIVQHCDADLSFQKQVLNAMKQQLYSKNVDSAAYAFLYDRVMINSGRKQKFGTQITYSFNGKPYLKNLQNMKKVNLFRSEVGLQSIEDYLNDMKSFKEEQDNLTF